MNKMIEKYFLSKNQMTQRYIQSNAIPLELSALTSYQPACCLVTRNIFNILLETARG